MLSNNSPQIRFANVNDCDLILEFIKALAEYEHLSHEVVATPELLKKWIFDEKKAEVLFAINQEGREVGFALFFNSFSTFLGKAGIYLEDLFVLPEYRGKGYGTLLLNTLAKITMERGCGRLEWSCLTWNKKSLDFYHRWGAQTLDDWVKLRANDSTLKALSR